MCLLMYVGIFTCKAPRALFWICALHKHSLLLLLLLKYMTNHADSEDILIDQQKIEKVTEFKYLGQTTHLKDTTKEVIIA